MKIVRFRVITIVLACLYLNVFALPATADSGAATAPRRGGPALWDHNNLFAWCVVPFDARRRTPEQRADMLKALGFTQFAYDWRAGDVPSFDEEIETLKKHHIDLLAWWFPLEADDPLAKSILETFRRHDVHPQLWVMQSMRGMPQTPEEWDKLLPAGIRVPRTPEEAAKLSDEAKAAIDRAYPAAWARANPVPHTAKERAERLTKEADRIYALAKLAAPYGSKVEIYNHNEWFGMMDNEVAIIKRLKERGVQNVGIVYNLSHARDHAHDDTKNFPEIWREIEPYVVAVNVTGIGPTGNDVYPSQGATDLGMLKVIQDSGWSGPIGLIAEMGGDAQVALHNDLVGLDWLAAELKRPDSSPPPTFLK